MTQKKSWFVRNYSWLLGAVALTISFLALAISWSNRQDYRATTRLELHPEITVSAILNEARPSVQISNQGDVEAVDLCMTVSLYEVDSVGDRTEVSKRRSQSGGKWFFSNFAVDDWELLSIPLEFTRPELVGSASAADSLTGLQKIALELRFDYRREVDRKLYIIRSLYFLNLAGQWASESSLFSDPKSRSRGYARTRDAVLSRQLASEFFPFASDQVHSWSGYLRDIRD